MGGRTQMARCDSFFFVFFVFGYSVNTQRRVHHNDLDFDWWCSFKGLPCIPLADMSSRRYVAILYSRVGLL